MSTKNQSRSSPSTTGWIFTTRDNWRTWETTEPVPKPKLSRKPCVSLATSRKKMTYGEWGHAIFPGEKVEVSPRLQRQWRARQGVVVRMEGQRAFIRMDSEHIRGLRVVEVVELRRVYR